VMAIGYQTAAQIADLPGRLPATASSVTTLWALLNVGLVAYVYLWARGVHHRRRSHRFPVALHAAYTADEDAAPTLPARLADLSRHGARLRVAEARSAGDRLRMVLLMEDGPLEVGGRVATVVPDRAPGPDPTDGWMLGVDLDPLPDSTADAIVAWCFLHPFGVEGTLPADPRAVPVPALSDRDAAGFSRLLAAAEMAAAAGRRATTTGRTLRLPDGASATLAPSGRSAAW
jgi:hypothetical protein